MGRNTNDRFYFFRSVNLQLNATNLDVQSSSLDIDYTCSSMYLTPINITINVSNGMQYTLECENGSISILDVDCGKTINICGFARFNVICMLSSCIEFVSEGCPTTPGPNPSPSPSPTLNPGKHALIQ